MDVIYELAGGGKAFHMIASMCWIFTLIYLDWIDSTQ